MNAILFDFCKPEVRSKYRAMQPGVTGLLLNSDKF